MRRWNAISHKLGIEYFSVYHKSQNMGIYESKRLHIKTDICITVFSHRNIVETL